MSDRTYTTTTVTVYRYSLLDVLWESMPRWAQVPLDRGSSAVTADRPAAFATHFARGSADECWPWIGEHSAKGYGRFLWRGKRVNAQRVAWEIANGPIPAGMLVCHSCDNPPCVNPEHLFLGTDRDNVLDMIAKGRRADTTGRPFGGNQFGPPRPIAERLLERLDRSGECWEWTGYREPKGYGVVSLRPGGNRRVHRVAWELVNGPVPVGQVVLHRCGNRACARPEHLFVGGAS